MSSSPSNALSLSLGEHVKAMYDVVKGRSVPGMYRGEMGMEKTGALRHVVEIGSDVISKCLRRIKEDANRRGVWAGISDPDMDGLWGRYRDTWGTCVWCQMDEGCVVEPVPGARYQLTFNDFEVFPCLRFKDWEMGVNIIVSMSPLEE